MAAGTTSVIGYVFIQPWLEKRFRLHDTCGVHNLHGMPAIIASITGIAGTATASQDLYGQNFTDVFPQGANQPYYQAAAAVVTLGIAIPAGLLTGWFLKTVELYFFELRLVNPGSMLSSLASVCHLSTKKCFIKTLLSGKCLVITT